MAREMEATTIMRHTNAKHTFHLLDIGAEILVRSESKPSEFHAVTCTSPPSISPSMPPPPRPSTNELAVRAVTCRCVGISAKFSAVSGMGLWITGGAKLESMGWASEDNSDTVSSNSFEVGNGTSAAGGMGVALLFAVDAGIGAEACNGPNGYWTVGPGFVLPSPPDSMVDS